jgi:Putative adhesin
MQRLEEKKSMRLEKSYSRILATASAVAIVFLLSLPVAAAAEGTFQRTLQVSGPVDLDLTNGAGSVEVKTGSAGQVQITGQVKVTNWFGGDAEQRVKSIADNPPIQQSGNEIRIGFSGDHELLHNVSISYELIVPADTRLKSHTGSGSQNVDGLRGQVEVESGSGNLKISNIGDEVRAEAGSGDIRIDQIKGNVHAKTGSGSIRAGGVAGGFEGSSGSGTITLDQSAPGSVRAETGSGGLDLRGVHGSLEATAGSGTISAEGNPAGSWNLHTGSGSVHLRLASDARFDLDARTSSGSISVSQPVTVQGTLGRKELHGQVHGGGVPVEVETGSGNIEIQ